MPARADPVAPSAVVVRLLGPPQIERDGRPASPDTRKAVALLAYLAMARRPVARDEVAAVLWPEADHTRARGALRRTLSALGSALGGHGLTVSADTIAVDRDSVSLDVDEFRLLATDESPDAKRRAAEIYRGDFLTGFGLRDSAPFDEWQLQATDELRRAFATVLERLSAEAGRTAPDEAIAFARRWLDLDPLHEPAHRMLMKLYAQNGDRASALRQYRECVAVLERDLGVEPLEETSELYDAIREDRVPAPPVAARATGAWPHDIPFVGRVEELTSIVEAYNAIDSDGRLVVIGGEAGIGKTRLSNEFLASRRGAVVISAHCHPEEERMALGTVTELLRAAGPHIDRATVAPSALLEAARLVPELATGDAMPPPLETPAARRRLFEGVSDVLTNALRGKEPGVLFVDDVHWADESSRDALRFLVRRLSGRAFCVVLTWRTEDVGPAHPLRKMLADASRAALATGITLGRLSPDGVTELVRAMGNTDDALAATLYEETAGVPFFVTEYVRAGGSGGGTLPPGVRDLLASRVENLNRTAIQVATAAAVIGRSFEPQAIRATSGRSEEEVAAALDELVAHGLITETDDAYDFGHPKLREYVYESATYARRRLLHSRAGDAFARSARRRPEIAALAAHHFERAGREEEAADFYRRAGDHARSVFANAEALSHYRSALALDHEDRAGLHEAIGDLLTLDGRYQEAITSYEAAAAFGADVATIEQKLGGVHDRLGEWDAADAHYAEALSALARDDRALRARVLADRSLVAQRRGKKEAAELATRALQEAERSGDQRALARAHNIAGIVALHRREVGEALRQVEASLDLAQRLDDASATAAALNNLSLVLRSSGDLEGALGASERSLELCTRTGDRHREAAVHSNLADVLRELGRSDEAMEHLKESAAIFAEVGEPDEPHPEIWKLVEW